MLTNRSRFRDPPFPLNLMIMVTTMSSVRVVLCRGAEAAYSAERKLILERTGGSSRGRL